MKLSLMVAISKNGVIGNGPDIPWSAKGEQLLFKAITYNQWLLVGRKTFESMGALPNRKYAVVTRSSFTSDNENVVIFPSIKDALTNLKKITDHVIVSGGGEIYKSLIDKAEHSDREQLVIRHLVDLCHDLGMTCVAEGIETDSQIELLKQLGCDRLQGFKIGKPMPADEFFEKFRPEAI